MKDLSNYVQEALIMSYDHEALKRKLKKKYDIISFHDIESKSKVRSFWFTVKSESYWDKITGDEGFFKLLEFYGYYVTEIQNVDNGEFDVRLEPNFGTKCTDFVYNNCKGVIYHVTSWSNYKNGIIGKGLKPFANSPYRNFTERVFFSCGETKEEIKQNIKDIIEQLNKKPDDIAILRIDLKKHKYNVDFYYDPSEDDRHNYIYANALFFSYYLDVFDSYEEFEEDIDKVIKEYLLANGKTVKLVRR